jgi:uncharacterized protein (DUF952 family)
MLDTIIYHIVTLSEWEMQKHQVLYSHPSLAIEGFIHCSTAEQLTATINRYYTNEEKVMVLHIDTTKVLVEIKYEVAPSVNQLFPHIYGELNLDAVVKVEEVIVTK